MKAERLTLILVNLAGIIERVDESLLFGVYEEVGAALHMDTTSLSSLTLFRSVAQSACYPLAAYLVHHNRAHVIALGAFLLAAATFLVAVSSTFLEVAISRGINGIGLAIVTPAILSLVADSTDNDNRGIAFGWLSLTGNFGSILGGFCSLLLTSTSFLGIPGWKIAFHLAGLITLTVSILVRLYAYDPNFPDRLPPPLGNEKSLKMEIKEMIKQANVILKIPSFQIIVAQGVIGSFSWSALSFTPVWLKLIGFSHKRTGFMWTAFVVGTSFGALFGGKMGDVISKKLPNTGRISLSQISSASAIPIAAILLLGLPHNPSTLFLHGFILFIMGLSISWNTASTNNPIFAEIVRERSRTSIYALDRSFESIVASFAPSVVGLFAQHICGYKPIPKGLEDSQEVKPDGENAMLLAKALYSVLSIPMAICCLIYSFLYFTYPGDRDRARLDALIESEIDGIKIDTVVPREEHFKLERELCETKMMENKMTVIEVDYLGEEGLYLDLEDDHEKRLLSNKLSSTDCS